MDRPSIKEFHPYSKKEMGRYYRMKSLKPEVNKVIFLFPLFNFKHEIK